MQYLTVLCENRMNIGAKASHVAIHRLVPSEVNLPGGHVVKRR
jgi:hypothetical protein